VIAPIRPPPTLFGSVNATRLKVSGVHVFSAVDFLGTPGTKSVVLSDQGRSTYQKAGDCRRPRRRPGASNWRDRQSKYVLEHIRCPSQLHSGGGLRI
jgi:hypothetical protein